MFHLLAYEETLGVNAANTDLDAVPDGEFSRRNDHFIFSDRFNLLLASYQATSATLARFNVPRWRTLTNAFHQIWPLNRAITVPSNPNIIDYRDMPLELPQEDEIAVEGSNNLALATEETACFLWIAAPSWTMNIPRGLGRQTARATVASYTPAANVWSADQAITFAETLAGGWYGVVGLALSEPAVLAGRLTFPRGNIYQGRKLRPGVLGTEAVANVESTIFRGGMGVFGYFHTFELPTLQTYNAASAARTPELWLDLIPLGQSFTPPA